MTNTTYANEIASQREKLIYFVPRAVASWWVSLVGDSLMRGSLVSDSLVRDR